MASSHAELEEKIRRAMSFEEDDDDDDEEEEEEEEEEDYEDDYEPEENGTAGKDAQNVAHESSINFTAPTSSLAAQMTVLDSNSEDVLLDEDQMRSSPGNSSTEAQDLLLEAPPTAVSSPFSDNFEVSASPEDEQRFAPPTSSVRTRRPLTISPMAASVESPMNASMGSAASPSGLHLHAHFSEQGAAQSPVFSPTSPIAPNRLASSTLANMGSPMQASATRRSPHVVKVPSPQRKQFETLTTRATSSSSSSLSSVSPSSPRCASPSASTLSPGRPSCKSKSPPMSPRAGSPRHRAASRSPSHHQTTQASKTQSSKDKMALALGHPAPWSPQSPSSILSSSPRHGTESTSLRSGLGSPAHGALQRAVRELRIVKAERDALREALKAANPQSVVDKTKAQMDREFRLVIKAMMDEKARALRAANAKTDFLREQLALEKNRAGMALAELEGMRTQRRADVPRRHENSQARTVPMQVRSGAGGPRVRFRRPDMLAPRAPTVSGRFVFASDEEEDEDGKSSNNEVITSPKVSPLRSRKPAPAPSRQPVLADSRRSPRQKPPRIKSREGSRVDLRQETSAGSAHPASPPPPAAVASNAPSLAPPCDRPAEVIFQSLLQAQPGTGQNVQVGRVRAFLKQSELLPPSMQAADLGVLLVKHSRRSSVVTLEQFQDLLADLALGLIRCGIVTVDENETTQETVGEPWEWGVREPRTKVSKASALRALGQVLFPPETDKKES